MSFPVVRPVGRALVVGSPSCRAEAVAALQRLGYQCAEAENPYDGMAELCRRPLVYRALILSLASIYKEELPLVQAVKRRYPHMEIWLMHTDSRQAALAEAMRLGADGLLSEDGLHRTGTGQTAAERAVPTVSAAAMEPSPARVAPPVVAATEEEEAPPGEPILSAEELRALLHEPPRVAPNEENSQ